MAAHKWSRLAEEIQRIGETVESLAKNLTEYQMMMNKEISSVKAATTDSHLRELIKSGYSNESDRLEELRRTATLILNELCNSQPELRAKLAEAVRK